MCSVHKLSREGGMNCDIFLGASETYWVAHPDICHLSRGGTNYNHKCVHTGLDTFMNNVHNFFLDKLQGFGGRFMVLMFDIKEDKYWA